jgi:hypothetical protein
VARWAFRRSDARKQKDDNTGKDGLSRGLSPFFKASGGHSQASPLIHRPIMGIRRIIEVNRDWFK